MTAVVISMAKPEVVALALALVVGVVVIVNAVAFIKDKLEKF